MGARAGPGQDPAVLEPDEIFGYGVDSGTGSFTSPEAVAALKAAADYEGYADSLMAAMPATAEAYELTGQVEVDPATGANVVAFGSGFGDGSTPAMPVAAPMGRSSWS